MITKQIAKHFREVHFGNNWTWVNLNDTLKEITWKQATTKIDSFNTIAGLTFHINYYVGGALNVLKGKPLLIKDEFSFDAPEINSKKDWENLLKKVWFDAKEFSSLVEQLPDSKLSETFFEEIHGNYYRNLHGVIEHTHYHLGQIVLIKKLLLQKEKEL